MNAQKALLAGFAAVLIGSTALAQDHKYDTWEANYNVQALLGAVKYEDLKFDNTDGTDDSVEIDISTIPQLGGAWTTRPQGDDRLQYGLECSFLLGFKIDKISGYLGGSGAYINISTSMWMFDLAGGGYANLWLTDDIRLYAAGGPLMMYADYQSDREYDDGVTPDSSQHESAFGLGLYARTGFEFRVHQHGFLGLGARWNWSNVDFSDVGGSSDISGIAAFATYTAGF